MQGHLDGLTLSKNGDLEVLNLIVTEQTTRSTVLKIPKLSSKLVWDDLWNRRVPSIVLEKPEIHLEQRLIDAFSKLNSASPDVPTKPSTLGGIKIGELKINEAKLHYRNEHKDSAEIILSYRGTDLETLANGTLRMGEQEMKLTEGRVKLATSSIDSITLPQLQLKGRVKHGVLDLDDVIIPQAALHLTPGVLQLFGINSSDASKKSDGAPLLQGIRIGHVKITDFTATTEGFIKGNGSGIKLPQTKVAASYEASALVWSPDKSLSLGDQKLHLTDVQVLAPNHDGHLRFKELSMNLSASDTTRWQVESMELRDPDIDWTSALRELLIKPSDGADNTSGRMPAILLKEVRLLNAQIKMSDKGIMPLDLATHGELKLKNLLIDDTGWHSASPQSLTLSEGLLGYSHEPNTPEKKPFLELPRAELVITPDVWNKDRGVEILHFEQPVIRLREANTPWFEPSISQAEKPATPISEPAVTPWYEQIHFRSLELNNGKVDLLTPGPKPVEAQASLNISTEHTDTDGNIHRLQFGKMEMRLPTLSTLPFPVARAAWFEGAVQLPQMWATHRIEELRLGGASVDAGEALMRLFETEPAAPASNEKQKPVEKTFGEPKIPWTVGHLSITESNVTLADVVPGLPGVRFGVKLDVENSPLEMEELIKNAVPQRIELANLNIPSPYEPLRSVAQLDSVFVNFTLAGLVQKEIEKVEIVSPTLFVGEDLFWYVDYYRKYTTQNAQPAGREPFISATGNALALAEAAKVIEQEPPTSKAAWSVKRLQVHSGKLVLAPKGKPLKGFREPFPFNIDTEIKRGTLEAAMEIPHDTYPIPDFDIQLIGMKGKVQFNLPLKEKDNNLVETFELDSLRWRKLSTGKAFLTVTYDAAGIYAQFGAEAYEGYVNGALNVYLDDNFHWDGWLGGKNVQTHDLTKILCPGYFLMDGRVEATLVAQGSKDELYQADGTFKNHTPGRFKIQALNQLIEDMPKEWSVIQQQITQIGLETMRDFDYDQVGASCRFYGREGKGVMRFIGPQGSRNFEINVYDHRWKTDEPALTKQ